MMLFVDGHSIIMIRSNDPDESDFQFESSYSFSGREFA
jgi:hypothetical protein